MTNRDDAHKSNAMYFGGEIMPLQEGGKKSLTLALEKELQLNVNLTKVETPSICKFH